MIELLDITIEHQNSVKIHVRESLKREFEPREFLQDDHYLDLLKVCEIF